MKTFSYAGMFLLTWIATANLAFGQQDTKAAPPKQDDKKQEKQEEKDPKVMIGKASYMIGRNFAGQLKSSGVELNLEEFLKGMKDVGADKDSAISDKEANEVMMWFDGYARKKAQAMMAERQKKMAEMADKNMREGEAFLKKNKSAEGVKELESGLQIIVEKAGTGPKPKSTDLVKVRYKGTLPNGKTFDSTEGGGPATFAVNNVIKGFGEGLMNIGVGGKAKIFIPAKIAYGMNPPPGGIIGPNQVLIFEIELVEIVK